LKTEPEKIEIKIESNDNQKLNEHETWTKVKPHYKNWEQKMIPIVIAKIPEPLKIANKKKFIPFTNLSNMVKKEKELIIKAERELFKDERIIGRKIAKKFLKRKISKIKSAAKETIIKFTDDVTDITDKEYDEITENISPLKVESTSRVRQEFKVNTKNVPYRTVKETREPPVKHTSSQSPTTCRTMNTQLEMPPSPRKFKSSKNKPKVMTRNNKLQENPVTKSMATNAANTLRLLVGLALIISTGYYLKSLSITQHLEEPSSSLPAATSHPHLNQLSGVRERFITRRSSPITTIGLDPSKRRDPTRWNLNIKDLSDIAQE
jgi:hypothetical protein